MRHRNDTEAAMTVAADPPLTVDVGEVVDLPDHVAGLTCLDDPCPATTELVAEPGPEPVADSPLAAVRASRRRTADTAEEA